MLISLRTSAGATIPLCTVDGDQATVHDATAQFSAKGPTVTAPVIGQRGASTFIVDSPEPAAMRSLITSMLTSLGMTPEYIEAEIANVESAAEASEFTFDRLTVSEDDVHSDYPLGEFGSADTTARDYHGRWTVAGGSGPHPKFLVGSRSPAQVASARGDIGIGLAEAGDDWDARAKVLDQISATGDASTAAEFDQIHGDQWTDARTKIHDEIIASRLAAAAHAGHDSEAVLVGGLPSAGKSSAFDKPEIGIDPTRYLHLDPDSVKQELLDRGLITRVPGMSDGEHAAMLHKESTHIIDRLHDAAVQEGLNVLIDKTMSSPPAEELAVLREAGYAVRGVFVDVSVNESLESADARWRRGGRFIPPSYIEQSRVAGETSKNMGVFKEMADQFDDWAVVNNRGISKGKPLGTVRTGSGKYEFALAGLAVFKSDATARDYHGRWTNGVPGNGQPGDAAASGDVVVADGKVNVQPVAAMALIENLGTRPESSDLTKVHIVGHPNLFGAVARNQLRRVDMPQIPTDRLNDFADFLHQRGVKTTPGKADPVDLFATQNELDGRKVGQMITAMKNGTMVGADHPLWISSDNKILDGHHRWAAEAVLSMQEPRKMTVVRVNVPMGHLIGQARQFAAANQIDSKHHGMTVEDRVSMRLDPMTLSQRVTRYEMTSEGARKAWITRHANGEKAAPVAAGPSVAVAGGGLGNGMPTAADFAKMTKTGGPLGSQGGGWYRDDAGQKYLVKPAQSKQHAENELASHLLYKHAGVPTDDTGVFNDGGQWFIAKKAIQGPDGKLGKIIGQDITHDQQRQAQDGFAIDALDSSWDAFGLVGDNVLTEGGTLYRIDVGGSGMYRAMGGDKPQFNPGKKWSEPDSLRSSNQGKKLYGDMSDADAAHQLSKLTSFDIAGYEAKLTAAGVDSAVRDRTVATIRDRIENQLPDILKRLG